ncbi:hypothetical protein H6P81_017796 [Aristolochia fimbriata]|uniref:USE1-like protein n=1 Tax=Aristolochia fimbriata TaxID=158543 RepID=A0AAV7E3G6_ARIFI|nr:hypothetical protein H6P81_017796 [Aristolochia fimbriata]
MPRDGARTVRKFWDLSLYSTNGGSEATPTAGNRFKCSAMRFSKTEVNLNRLLSSAPQQQNQTKLLHYVATLRELLEKLGEETTPDGLPRLSKAKINEYSEKIEAIAAKLAAVPTSLQESLEAINVARVEETPRTESVGTPPGLRRRFASAEQSREGDKGITLEATGTDRSKSVKLDVSTQAHIEKHRNLQEDLTDEMVELARQLKESSIMMSQSVQNTEKILDSTERAVEHSLASTGRANVRAMEVYSESVKTSCLTWLVIFIMTCIFIMVVLLIRVT